MAKTNFIYSQFLIITFQIRRGQYLLNNMYFAIIIVTCKLKVSRHNGRTCTIRYYHIPSTPAYIVGMPRDTEVGGQVVTLLQPHVSGTRDLRICAAVFPLCHQHYVFDAGELPAAVHHGNLACEPPRPAWGWVSLFLALHTAVCR